MAGKMHKKGFEMMWSTWVIMVLAFVLLIFLILFFTNAGKNFFENTKGYFSSNNIDAIVKSCNLLSSGGQEYSFCCDKKEIVYNGKNEMITCYELIDRDFINNKVISSIKCEDIVC